MLGGNGQAFKLSKEKKSVPTIKNSIIASCSLSRTSTTAMHKLDEMVNTTSNF